MNNLKAITKMPTSTPKMADEQLLIIQLAIGNVFSTKLGVPLGEKRILDNLHKYAQSTSEFLELAQIFSAGQQTKRDTKIRFYELLLTLLLEECLALGINPTIKNVLERSGRLSILIDRAFPGYIESGFLPLIIKAL